MAHYVIIGNGVAGTKAASAIRSADAGAEITILSADDRPFYLRPKLADFVAGKIPEAGTGRPQAADFYPQLASSLRLDARGHRAGHRQAAAHAGRRRVRCAYDRLLIATGGRPATPAFPGSDLDGVVYPQDPGRRPGAEGPPGGRRQARSWLARGCWGWRWPAPAAQSGADVDYLLRGERFWPEVLDDDARGPGGAPAAGQQVTIRRESGDPRGAWARRAGCATCSLTDGENLPMRPALRGPRPRSPISTSSGQRRGHGRTAA